MSKLLLDEKPLQVLPSLAVALGSLDEAVILQQLHYWLEKSNNVRDGYKWVYNTMNDWQKQFPWIKSVTTVRKHFKHLESLGLIVTGNYNPAGFDRKKWYRIDYDTFFKYENAFTNNCQMETPKVGECKQQELVNANANNWQTYSREYTETTSENTQEKIYSQAEPDGVEPNTINQVISYLNEKTGSHYKLTTPKTRRLITARLKEGFTLDEFKIVIDKKNTEWANNDKMSKFLRPETLFGTKFETYLNEKVKGQPNKNDPYYTEKINPMTGQPDPNGLTRYQMDNEYW